MLKFFSVPFRITDRNVNSLYKLVIKILPLINMSYYAVRNGKVPGVYRTWAECNEQVSGFSNAAFKKFKIEAEAWEFVNKNLMSGSKRQIEEVYNNQKHFKNGIAPTALPTRNLNDVKSSIIVPQDTFRKKSYYAVHRGKRPGVYETWSECEIQIKSFQRPSYRKFDNNDEAIEFVKTGGIKKLNRREGKNVEINTAFIHKELENYTVEDVKVNSGDVVTVFTDGASSKNGRTNAAAGIGVYWGPNHPLNTSMRLAGRQTNNRAEIYAATFALQQAQTIGAKNVKLYTDSQFLIHGITDWIFKWKKNGWKLANGQPVVNKDDFIELDRARQGLNVEFIYIKAHDNNPGNVEADKLAVEGARKDISDTFVCLA